ncbi:cryptochrome/photolyase family protein [Parapusillimonas granuli]|uniref:Deoxyribodipyrimidine photo-lyase n=1 Tax=Parapusillimonas granuli TaxID=380911 RepID=A0A853FXP6_9BURK|nr:deoxyribodipyrimidine photo-lyase [Parapusillimonas granuli]MBB5217609.1 deoxyribodipyrimidine photo-lyase [Parapusillimonas granuli]NYT49628.1 deoxyribodipyrimidine photo-lyase [Parapusillimonas granuli]
MQNTDDSVPSALVWLRRDLRCDDHAALYHALRRYKKVYCAFVFDTDLLDALPTRVDRRVEFIHESVLELNSSLQALAARSGVRGGGLIVRHGPAVQCIVQLAQELGVREVLANRDYEPEAIARDRIVADALRAAGVGFSDYKDHALLDRDEVLTQQGRPYSVFTPYYRAWLQKLDDFQLKPYPIECYAHHLAPRPAGQILPALADLGFAPTNLRDLALPTGTSGAQRLLQDFLPRMSAYQEARDYPGRKGVSYLSVHLRFGTISIRQVAALAAKQAAQGCAGARVWLSELAWRDFYFMILWHNPQLVTQSFKSGYDRVQWDDAPDLWNAWSAARTGYPLVDAALRQLLQTGYMHNRLRMVVASFLTKDLGIDWRRGERFFAQHLNDYDLAANNGGWQWAASTGCDAQPWFRIFNPVTQSQRFDPDGNFIRRYLPELSKVPTARIHYPAAMKPAELAACGLRLGVDYPLPVVDHARARTRTLMRFSFLSEQ